MLAINEIIIPENTAMKSGILYMITLGFHIDLVIYCTFRLLHTAFIYNVVLYCICAIFYDQRTGH